MHWPFVQATVVARLGRNVSIFRSRDQFQTNHLHGDWFEIAGYSIKFFFFFFICPRHVTW